MTQQNPRQRIKVQEKSFLYGKLYDNIQFINRQFTRQEIYYYYQHYFYQPTKNTEFLYESFKYEMSRPFMKRSYNLTISHNRKYFQDYEKEGHIHHVRRKVRLIFRCKNRKCPYLIQQKQQRTWRTILGLVEFKAYFDKKNILRYLIYIYGQKCLSCKQYVQGQSYKSDLLLLAQLYRVIVELIINFSRDRREGIWLTNYQQNGQDSFRNKKNANIEKHNSKQCEACHYNKCFLLNIQTQQTMYTLSKNFEIKKVYFDYQLNKIGQNACLDFDINSVESEGQ